MDEQTKIDYDAHQKALAISGNVIETATLEGELIGEARGEAKANEKIVCNAFKKLNNIDAVAYITGLAIDQIYSILSKYNLTTDQKI